jgi:hypothetical protein
MVTVISSLAAGLDGRVVRYGMDAKDYQKHEKIRKSSQTFFDSLTFSTVDSLSTELLNITTRLPTFLCPLPPTLCALLVNSPPLHSLCHDTRLIVPSPVHTLASSPT